MDCLRPNNCYAPLGAFGVLSVSSDTYSNAYSAGVGWDFATGIGTVNVEKLVKRWDTAP